MLESLILYVLCVYFVFHIVSRSTILEGPRTYLVQILPSWVTYPLFCAFCFTWWIGWGLGILILLTTGLWVMSILNFMAAPVMAFIIDLCVQWLLRMNISSVVR